MRNRKVFKLFIGFGLLLCCAAFYSFDQQKKPKWVAPASADSLKNAVPVSKASLSQGKSVYAKYCKSCHGSSGKGDGPKAKGIEVPLGDFTSKAFQSQTDGAIYWKISEGRDPMPTYKKRLEAADRWAVVNYIRTMGKK